VFRRRGRKTHYEKRSTILRATNISVYMRNLKLYKNGSVESKMVANELELHVPQHVDNVKTKFSRVSAKIHKYEQKMAVFEP